MPMKRFFVFLYFIVYASGALAEIDPFLQDKARGWFWKEPIPQEEEPKKEEEKPQEPVVVIEGKKEEKAKEPPTFSVEWFQKNYLSILHKAIDDPTPENVDKWRLATRVMLDKASNVVQVFRERLAVDPDLDEQNRYPIANVMRSQMQANLTRNIDSALNYLSDKMGLWIFLDENCNFCRIQYHIIKKLAEKTKLEIRYIVKQGRPIFGMSEDEEVLPDLGQSEFLNIKLTPAIVMVIPPDKYIVLSQGMLSADIISERILLAAKSEGLLDKERYAETNPNVAGLITPDQINSLADLKLDSPDFSKRIREIIQKNMGELNATRVNRPKLDLTNDR